MMGPQLKQGALSLTLRLHCARRELTPGFPSKEQHATQNKDSVSGR